MRPANEALIVIDMQNDFCPGGALAVEEGDTIVPGINALMDDFAAVILTQDWHPADHLSFASQHAGAAPMSMTECPMAHRCSGPITACRERRARRFIPTCAPMPT